MQIRGLILAFACFLLSLVIFMLAEGARAIYSGGFFAVLGFVLLWNARRAPRESERKSE